MDRESAEALLMKIPSSMISSENVASQAQKSRGAAAAKNDDDSDDVKVREVAPAPVAAGLSKMAELMKQLDGLRTTDPAKFKAVTAEIGKQLKSLATKETGEGTQHLSELASKFSAASQTGTLEPLKPQHQHRGTHAQGAAAYAKQQPGGNAANATLRSDVDAIIAQALQAVP